MRKEFKSCYIYHEDDLLTIGNSLVERKIAFRKNVPTSLSLKNKSTNFSWENNKFRELAIFQFAPFDWEKSSMEVSDCYESSNYGLSDIALCVDIVFESNMTILWKLSIYPDTPFITSQLFLKGKVSSTIETEIEEKVLGGVEKKDLSQDKTGLQFPKDDVIEAFRIDKRHVKMDWVRLFDMSDLNDQLIRENSEMVYFSGNRFYRGNIFILNNYVDEEKVILIKEAPTYHAQLNRKNEDLSLGEYGSVSIYGNGIDYEQLTDDFVPAYSSAIGVAIKDEKQEIRNYYQTVYNNKERFIMSNTWGDRNADKCVCESFILKEIDKAVSLGVDIVQIDDGWQKGITANSSLQGGGAWETGFYLSDPDFWKVHPEKFPNGLDKVIDYANSKNIKIGLWFAPDCSAEYDNYQKDIEVLLSFYKKYNIKYFKLDSFSIKSKKCEIRLIELLTTLTKESNGQVVFNMDITNGKRLGHLYQKQFGTIFVENRYSDWGNYYPHNTLRNLWELSKYIPSNKLLFEVLNLRRNENKYLNDPFAPTKYDIDYVFASVMVSNPLIWMEMSYLNDEDCEILAKIIKCYKAQRDNFKGADVISIGDCADGMSFTGFNVKCNDDLGYLVLLREASKENEYNYSLKDTKNKKIEILYSNDSDAKISNEIDSSGNINVKFSKERSVIFAKYN